MERARQLAPVLAELKGTGMSARRMAAELMALTAPSDELSFEKSFCASA
jgi:hypothetical protein